MNLPSEGQGEAAESAVLPLEFRLVAAEVDGAASEGSCLRWARAGGCARRRSGRRPRGCRA